MIDTFSQSNAMLEEALKVIPLGSQTFSKSLTQYPGGVSPFFAERASGAIVTDVDGNEFIDFNNALACITLGHCDPDVTAAVSEQLTKGTIFPLGSRLEIDVAELIIDMVPCAEGVRFGKNGSDATAGAVRAARAFTGRERVAVCGYHGWQDWYIGSTSRNRGVPQAVRDLTHVFPYNDLKSLEALLAAHPGEFAAVILEPMNVVWPEAGFLQGLVDLARKHGAVAIFDETITGFRYAPGGAQDYFGVTPDLACFGKGLANGYPLSAVVGRADIMKVFEDIFFSFTMGGETLSLAAARAALTKIREARVTQAITARGTDLLTRLDALIEETGCGTFLKTGGHPSWSFLLFDEKGAGDLWGLKTLWLQEMHARGILTLGTHNLTFAHKGEHVDRLMEVYGEVLPILKEAVENKSISQLLRCEPLKPLFKVR
jgi:glutamate-1-semialdehyde 2,1-aminomutase